MIWIVAGDPKWKAYCPIATDLTHAAAHSHITFMAV